MEEEKYSMHIGAKPIIFQFAESLREQETEAEKKLWELLRNNKFMNLKFRRQHPISNYIADFYNHELKLCIEIDGNIHEEKAQKLHDIERDNFLKSNEIIVIRFSNFEVLNNIENILIKLEEICDKLQTK